MELLDLSLNIFSVLIYISLNCSFLCFFQNEMLHGIMFLLLRIPSFPKSNHLTSLAPTTNCLSKLVTSNESSSVRVSGMEPGVEPVLVLVGSSEILLIVPGLV